MVEQDRPFICYKAGLRMSISPRNAFGWWSLAAWLALLGMFTVLFVWVIASRPTPAQQTVSIVAYVLLTIVWSIAMIRWMYVRSEVIDMAELMKLKKELDKRKGGRL